MPTPEQVLEELSDPAAWRGWVGQAWRVLLIVVIAWVLTRVTRWAMPRIRSSTVRLLDRRHEGATLDVEKRAKTLSSAINKFIDTVIWTVAVITVLKELSYHVEPLLAGLGIAGIAVGFGAQTLVKDWLAGFFLLIEDQIRIGDAVVINEIAGVVEAIDLRTTILRGENGAVHVISNGSIIALSNMTREYSYYVFATTVAHEADADRALKIIESVGNEIYADEKFRPVIFSPIEVMGVDCLAERGVVLKARIKTLPGQQALVGRELNRRVNSRLKAEGIPFPQLPPPPAR